MASLEKLSKWHRDTIKSLKKLGLEIDEVRTKNHIVIKGRLNGVAFTWQTSKTPSSPRAYKDMIADLRRELRRCEIIEPPPFAVKFLTFPDDKEIIWQNIRAIEEELKK